MNIGERRVVAGGESRTAIAMLAAALVLSVSPAALAQAPAAQSAGEPQAGDEHSVIVVTGTATPVTYEKIGNTVSIIGGEAIEARGTAYLQDVLREVPGLAVSQSGSFGSQTAVRIRGAEGNHVLVLVDGVEVSAIGT